MLVRRDDSIDGGGDGHALHAGAFVDEYRGGSFDSEVIDRGFADESFEGSGK